MILDIVQAWLCLTDWKHEWEEKCTGRECKHCGKYVRKP